MQGLSNPLLGLTIKASAAVAAGRFVTYAGAHAAAGAIAAGVTHTKAAANENVNVITLGVMRVEAGAAIAKNAELQVGADGKAITRAAGKSVGFALDAAAADGDFISAVLIQSHS